MKILFLQKVDNAKGGVIQVNISLMKAFVDKGYEVNVCSLRHGYTWEDIIYPKEVFCHVVNTKEIWGCPLLSEALQYFKKGHIGKCLRILTDRLIYKHKIHKDYQDCKAFIIKSQPDIIIVSHYELLSGIPSSYEKKTIMHFHTSFDQVMANRSYMKYFNQYKNHIFGFVWLSKGTAERAKKAGIANSRFIYNPLTFHQEAASDLKQKTCVFVGRMASEKRVWLAIQHFVHVCAVFPELQDWTLELYGDGDETIAIKELVKNHSNVHYNGVSECVQNVFMKSSIMLLTSAFEGMPLVVLEANECGVPVIAYDFGEASEEVILHGKSGMLIHRGDEKAYEKELADLMRNDDERIKLGTYAKSYAQSFSIERIVQEWMNLFDEINKQNDKDEHVI